MTRILAIHGFLGSANDWLPLKELISKRSQSVDFQCLDIFKNKEFAKFASLSEWAKALNEQQKNLHVERNILMGYSLGGRLALHAAVDKPGLWDDVVLLSAHPGLLGQGEREARQNKDKKWAEQFANLPWEEVVNLWNNQPVFLGGEEKKRDESDYNRDLLTHALINWSLGNQEFLGEGMKNIKPKMHWYAGEKDQKFINLFNNLKIDGFIDSYRVVKGASHRIIFDNPAELAERLIEDLKI